MIIGIDASKTGKKQKTGIDNAAYQIILNLKNIDDKNTYYLYSNKPVDHKLIGRNFHEKLIPFPRLWNKFRLPLALLKDKPDSFLELTYAIPSFAPVNTAVLIHDLAFKFFPEAYSTVELMFQESAIKAAIARAKIIILTSKENKKDFLKFYKYPENQIKIVPLAYDHNIYRTIDKPKDVLKLDSPYFLYVGRLEKRKNIVRLLEAFAKFKSEGKNAQKLVLVGKEGYGYDEINKLINSSETLKKNVIKTGFLDNEELASLYNLADAFVYPSLYEGFGLPILEAFACSAPVLTSDIGTLKEVAMNGALYVNPLKVDDIYEGMCKISSDNKLRNRLINNGKERIKDFSWDKTGKDILTILDKMK